MPPKRGNNKGKAPAHFGSSPRVTRSQAALASSLNGNDDDSASESASSPPSSNNSVSDVGSPPAEEVQDDLSAADDEIADVDMILGGLVADLAEEFLDAPVENAPLPVQPAQADPASSPADVAGNNDRRPIVMPRDAGVIDLTADEDPEDAIRADSGPPVVDLTSAPDSPPSSSSARRRQSRRSISPLQGRSRRVSFRDRTPERRGQGGGVSCGGGLAFRGVGRQSGGVLASGGDGGVGVVAAPGSGGFPGGRMSKDNLASSFDDPTLNHLLKQKNKYDKAVDNKTNEKIAQDQLPGIFIKYLKDLDDTFVGAQGKLMEAIRHLVRALVTSVYNKKAKLDKEKAACDAKRENEGNDDDDDDIVEL